MTNRDYLKELTNKELAEFLKGSEICTCMMETCHDYINCEKCIKKWLETERKPNVEEGQIRETDSHKWLVGSVNTNRDICGMIGETGVIRYIPTDIVDTWKIATDETEEIFYNKITHDFYDKISNILKEINKEI